MNYRIYQIPLNEETRDYVFEHRETLEKKGMYPPPRSLYKLVYEGECEMISPVAIFQLHNQDNRPARKSIRSMSTSDILVFEHKGDTLALFRDYIYFWPILFSDDRIEDIVSEYFVRNKTAYVRLKYGEQTVEVDISQLQNGCKYFKNECGEKIKLGLSQIYSVLQAAMIVQNEIKYNGKPKTMEEWESSGITAFDDYVALGDEVDEEIVDNYLGMVPPACHSKRLMQMGEADQHLPNANGSYKATYMTFEKSDGQWYYRGYCFLCDTRNKKRFPTFPETLAKLI